MNNWIWLYFGRSVRDAHACGLEATGLFERRVNAVLLEERLVLLRSCIICAVARRAVLADLGIWDVAWSIDLCVIVVVAEVFDVLDRRCVSILVRMNRVAGEAGHVVDFVSRL